MVGLKAKRYSWNIMSIHYCLKTTATFNKSVVLGNQSELIITHWLVSSFFWLLILHFSSDWLAYLDSGSYSQPVWITGLHSKCSEANTSQNDLAGNALEEKKG